MKTLAFLMLMAFGSSQAIAAVELKLGHFAADGTPNAIAALQFKTNVEKRTNGEVKINVFGNNALGSPPEVLEQVMLGAVDMSLSGQDQLAKNFPFYDTISTPFAFKDYAMADKIIDGDFKAWAEPELAKKGLVHLSDWEWGFRQLTNSKKSVVVPADMKGMKIRTPPAFAYQAFVEAAGGNAVTIAFPELVMAMKQGVVDGQENPVGTIYALKLYETQKYMTILNYTYSSMVHVVNKRSWDKLTPAQQQIVREESASAAKFARKTVRDEEATQLKDLETTKGIVVSRPDLGPWKAAMGPAWEKVKAKVGPDNFNRFMGMVDKNSK
ncbi:TRAP transporter substrate-binding protein [Uliginosibacterium sp. H3]|uniref:TRAP transporter substrate-binding protein n=1 Tax=Uliginosibacterium silvisoli TaxID=3114758 RepID=A0ABU6K3G6_9RHOO|nr:TRAP transporter substrate-binding protein [Uliginosibacterium sp. H3]